MAIQWINYRKLLIILIFAFPFLLYLNTVQNDYALDDSIVITENAYVKNGTSGIKEIFNNDAFTGFFNKKKDLVAGGRYRPLSVATFAVENSIWHNNPHISHFINAILYGILCIVLFLMFEKIVIYFGSENIAVPVALISIALFAFHPIHTEVIANIKGRDEILALLFGSWSLLLFMTSIEKRSVKLAAISGFLLLTGLLSKENALTILVIAFLLILMRSKKEKLSVYATPLFSLLLATLLYLMIRFYITGGHTKTIADELMNNPYLFATGSEKAGTILYTLLLYLKLLVFPHPLTYDYYPYHIQLHSLYQSAAICSLMIHLFLLFASIYFIRNNKLIAFAILFYFITLLPVSNLLLNIGSFMNERFIFFSSTGFCLLFGYLIYLLLQRIKASTVKQNVVIVGLLIIISLFAVTTIARNTQWKDNYTLFLHDVKISSQSAKGNCAAGGILYEKAEKETDPVQKKQMLDRSVLFLNKALQIYPQYVDALLLLGNDYYLRDKEISNAMNCYLRLFELAPGYELAYDNLKKMLITAGDPKTKVYGYQVILRFQPSDFDANYQLGVVYGRTLNKLDSAIFYLTRAVKIKPDSKEACRDAGVALAIYGEPEKAIPYFENTIKLEPNEPSNYINLGLAYQKTGMISKANELFKKAEELKRNRTIH